VLDNAYGTLAWIEWGLSIRLSIKGFDDIAVARGHNLAGRVFCAPAASFL